MGLSTLLLLSYLGVFVAGYLTGAYVVPWALGVVARPTRRLGQRMGEGDSMCRGLRGHVTRSQAWAMLVVVAFGTIAAGFGVMLFLDGRSEARQTARLASAVACVNEWGADYTSTAKEARKATAELRRAEARRDRSFDRVVEVAARRALRPPMATREDYLSAIVKAGEASVHLEGVRNRTGDALEQADYPAPPTLACDIEEEGRG